MADVAVNGRVYPNIQLIAFDKDGTLLDFHCLWGQKAQRWVNWLVNRAQNLVDDPHFLRLDLCRSLGYDPKTNRVINDSPIAVASMPTLATIAAVVLYQHGLSWHDAEEIAQQSLPVSINAHPTQDQVQPIGDVSSAIARLAQAGVRIAIITSDDRAATEATLPLLGIAGLVDVLVCGDDDVPNKPAPDALWQMGRQFDVDPAQMLMVGDTAGDMIFGRNAGVSGCIGIRGGAGDPFKLSHHANSIVDSINCIEVVNPLTDSPRLV